MDFLTKKQKVNEGEHPQYYAENSHPAIISQEAYDLAQNEIRKRQGVGAAGRSGECGGYYGSKVWRSTGKYRRAVWQRNDRYKKKGAVKCRTPHLSETVIQRAFITAFNQILEDKSLYIEDYTDILETLTGTAALDKEAAKLTEECTVVYGLIQRSIEENVRMAQDQDDYNERHNGLLQRYDTAKTRLNTIESEIQSRTVRKEKIQQFLSTFAKRDGLLDEFDEELWCATVESVTVRSEKDVAVLFRDGTKISVNLQEEII